jgi:histidinol dehydrogenase
MTRLRRFELASASPENMAKVIKRSAVPDPAVRAQAHEICQRVRAGGDQTMAELGSRLGGGFRRVEESQLEEAAASLTDEVKAALEQSIEQVSTFHRAQLPSDLEVVTLPGIKITRRWSPLRRVGAYVPGGKAAYPSTVVMTVVPARLAGVEEVLVASPAAPDGSANPVLLAACWLTGASEVWLMGGAQAVAALAYGTESVERVEKIVGPGNTWVTAAKLAVFGEVAIDLPAGPSEVLVLADESAHPRLVAIDLLCQAEHGPDSPAVLVTTHPPLVERVEIELESLLVGLGRREILAGALHDHGLAVIAADRQEALAFANHYASEHVTIMTSDPDADAKQITAAGSVYIGRWSAESAGDYATGANHVLPTGGLAAACGPLSVEDFGSWRQEQRLTREGLSSIRSTIGALATSEGLTAHRLAAELRFEEEP